MEIDFNAVYLLPCEDDIRKKYPILLGYWVMRSLSDRYLLLEVRRNDTHYARRYGKALGVDGLVKHVPRDGYAIRPWIPGEPIIISSMHDYKQVLGDELQRCQGAALASILTIQGT